MSIRLPRLDLTQIFCDVDDFYIAFETACNQTLPLPSDGEAKPYRSRLRLSEVMTIVIAFHGSGFRTFKDFYTGFRGQWNKKQRQGRNPYGTWISAQTFLVFVTLIIPEAYTRQWI